MNAKKFNLDLSENPDPESDNSQFVFSNPAFHRYLDPNLTVSTSRQSTRSSDITAISPSNGLAALYSQPIKPAYHTGRPSDTSSLTGNRETTAYNTYPEVFTVQPEHGISGGNRRQTERDEVVYGENRTVVAVTSDPEIGETIQPTPDVDDGAKIVTTIFIPP